MGSLRKRVIRLEGARRPHRHVRSVDELTDDDLMQIVRAAGFDPNDDATMLALAEGRIT